ncbi:nuclear transport factor 2 family protein [Rhodococcus sp. NPDC003348]
MPHHPGLDPAHTLLAIEEIKAVFAKRLRVMDAKQWDLYPTCHTDDVVSATYGGLPQQFQPQTEGESNRVVGPEAVTKAISGFLDGGIPITSVHHGHTPEIELTSATTARGVWAMEDHLWWQDGDVEQSLHGYGHYHEEYRCVDGRWLISYRSLSRLRVDATDGFYGFLSTRL